MLAPGTVEERLTCRCSTSLFQFLEFVYVTVLPCSGYADIATPVWADNGTQEPALYKDKLMAAVTSGCSP